MEKENMMESEALGTEAEQQSECPPASETPSKDRFLKKCDEIYEAWDKAAKRLKKDLSACCKNPYIRKTTTCKVEIFRSREDTTPIDSFETENKQGFSLSTFLMASGVALLLACCMPKMRK